MTTARLLILLGLILLLAGGGLYLLARLGVTPGRLPGDLRIVRSNSTCVIALGTSILLSVVLTLILNLVVRFINK